MVREAKGKQGRSSRMSCHGGMVVWLAQHPRRGMDVLAAKEALFFWGGGVINRI